MFHCIDAWQLDRSFLEEIGIIADAARAVSKTKEGADWLATLLSHKRAMLYFVQPSTRTYLSFLSACQILGMKTADVRDTSTSSEVKGESELDTVRTFSSYYDVIIMRHPKPNFAREIADMLDNSKRPVPVINGGSGKDQHPTQALLDIYTLINSFEHRGGIDGKKIAFVGDLVRGRTARSLSILLARFQNVKQYFVAPEFLQIDSNTLSFLEEQNVSYECVDDINNILPHVDAVYLTRLQDEWDETENTNGRYNVQNFAISDKNVHKLQPGAIILHPLPRRQEISPEVDDDPRAMYWRQVRNGMWARVALLSKIFGVQERIIEHSR